MVGEILNIGGKIIDKIFPDKDKANEAKVKLLELQQSGEFKEDELRYEAITAEAQSSDKWTSRARPSFMYVIYILLLASVPLGIFYAISPDNALLFVEGFRLWFEAIPAELYGVFTAGYLGYSGARTYEKVRKVSK